MRPVGATRSRRRPSTRRTGGSPGTASSRPTGVTRARAAVASTTGSRTRAVRCIGATSTPGRPLVTSSTLCSSRTGPPVLMTRNSEGGNRDHSPRHHEWLRNGRPSPVRRGVRGRRHDPRPAGPQGGDPRQPGRPGRRTAGRGGERRRGGAACLRGSRRHPRDRRRRRAGRGGRDRGTVAAAGTVTADALRQETTTNNPMPTGRAAGYGLGVLLAVAGLGGGWLYLRGNSLGWAVGAGVSLLVAAGLLSYLGATQSNRHKAWMLRMEESHAAVGDRFAEDPAAARFGVYTLVNWLIALAAFVVLTLTVGWAWSWLAIVGGLAVMMILIARMLFAPTS